jgi:ribonuclease J
MTTEDIVASNNQVQFQPNRLYCFPLGGQNEIGQTMWAFCYGGKILLVDAGAAYPPQDLPGVDLLFPNTSFLESRQDSIVALLLTNGHEEHSGAVAHALRHLDIPVIMAPEFVLSLFKQTTAGSQCITKCDTITVGEEYKIDPFIVEWVRVNDAIADACALYIQTPAASIFYTSSFKLDQTPVDGQLLNLSRIAQIGEEGLDLLISDSAGVEKLGYTPSERSVAAALKDELSKASSRVFIVLPGTNTHRLQLIFDIALKLKRKVILYGETLIQTAVAAVATGNLKYDRKIEAGLDELGQIPDDKVLIVATGSYGEPMELLNELAADLNPSLSVRAGDTIIYSAGISLGSSRAMAILLDAFLAREVKIKYGAGHQIHVSKHAGLEELKLMLTMAKPKIFAPAFGEGRHIAHHAQTAVAWGMSPEAVFSLRNGDVLEVANGMAAVAGSVDAAPVFYNRDQDEKITMQSVKERRNLSYEGVITIACAIDRQGNLAAEPVIEGGASGFLQSLDWLAIKAELKEVVANAIAGRDVKSALDKDIDELKDSIREQVNKLIRGRLLARPLVQVVVQVLPVALHNQRVPLV